MIPLLRVCRQWRCSALGDPSLWTTIYLSSVTPPLLDTILTHTGKRLLKIHIDCPEIGRRPRARLQKVVDRIEELDCWVGTDKIFSFLSSLGPVPNLKAFRLRNEVDGVAADNGWEQLPVIFQDDGLASLPELSLTTTVIWPFGLFRGIRSFELGAGPRAHFSPTHFLDVLRESPLVEDVRLVGTCLLSMEGPPTVALQSLKNCTLIRNGAINLVWYLDIPPTASVFLSTPPRTDGDGTELYPFRDLCFAPDLQVLDQVSVASISIGFDAVRLRAQNDSGGTLTLQVYYHENTMTGLIALSNLIQAAFSGRVCVFTTTKTFEYHIERGASRDDAEAVFNVSILSRFTDGTPGLQQMKLDGVPAKVLSLHLKCLHNAPPTVVPFPDLQRLYIESTPLRSPKSLLEDLSVLLKKRKDLGAPLQFVNVKVHCERLITMTEHSAFLAAWEGLVGGDVEVEYSRDTVQKLPRRGKRICYFNSEDESEDEEAGEAAETAETDGESDVEWESWISGEWPKAVSEMREQTEA